jgi:hypothetical protein
MFRHRLAPEADYYRLPKPPAPTIRPQGFALCPIAVIAGCTAVHWAGLQQIYFAALEQAQTWARPSVLERDLLAFWN